MLDVFNILKSSGLFEDRELQQARATAQVNIDLFEQPITVSATEDNITAEQCKEYAYQNRQRTTVDLELVDWPYIALDQNMMRKK